MASESDAREDFSDRSRSVREGEGLDGPRLLEYLREHLPGLEGHLEVEQFPAGFSSLTVLRRAGGEEFVLRRPPVGAQIKTAHYMAREFRFLSRLRPVFPKLPRPVLFCEDESI